MPRAGPGAYVTVIDPEGVGLYGHVLPLLQTHGNRIYRCGVYSHGLCLLSQPLTICVSIQTKREW